MTSDEEYRLIYKDVEGVLSDRYIIIKKLIPGDKLSASYIYAYCLSAMGFRQFRFDRIKSLYIGHEKIKDPYSYLMEKHHDLTNPDIDIEELARQALGDTPNKMAYHKPIENTPPPEKQKINISEIEDIPTLKKMYHNFCWIFSILVLLGLLSIPTIILPILFFGGAACVLYTAHTVKKRIKEIKTSEKVK